jgi:hypothetical protein
MATENDAGLARPGQLGRRDRPYQVHPSASGRHGGLGAAGPSAPYASLSYTSVRGCLATWRDEAGRSAPDVEAMRLGVLRLASAVDWLVRGHRPVGGCCPACSTRLRRRRWPCAEWQNIAKILLGDLTACFVPVTCAGRGTGQRGDLPAAEPDPELLRAFAAAVGDLHRTVPLPSGEQMCTCGAPTDRCVYQALAGMLLHGEPPQMIAPRPAR